jgi:hypothetical protein
MKSSSLVNTSLSNMNLDDFFQILGLHLEAKHLIQKSKNSLPGRISFQIYHRFSSRFKQNGLPMISSINTIFCGIFGGLEDQVWNLEK